MVERMGPCQATNRKKRFCGVAVLQCCGHGVVLLEAEVEVKGKIVLWLGRGAY